MLRVEHLACGYGRLQVLWDVSLYIDGGEIVSVVGANGAGKSTLLHAISGLLRCTAGKIIFRDQEITRIPSFRRSKLGLSQVPEGRCLFLTMTVFENLELGAYGHYREIGNAHVKKDMEEVFKIFPRLSERRNQKVGTLSGGEQQMVAIGRSLMSRPKVLLLDEPSQGLAPLLVKEILGTVVKLRQRGISVLLVEQNAAASLALSDRAYVLEIGKVTLEGDAKELAERGEVKRAYLGSKRWRTATF
jgi:branched-chain amino acid transport system ATP-binding protein